MIYNELYKVHESKVREKKFVEANEIKLTLLEMIDYSVEFEECFFNTIEFEVYENDVLIDKVYYLHDAEQIATKCIDGKIKQNFRIVGTEHEYEGLSQQEIDYNSFYGIN